MYSKYSELRDARGVSDYEVARETKLSRSTLSEWKTGVHKPGLETLQKIARYFGVSVDYFLEG